jgi:hypothetical protein
MSYLIASFVVFAHGHKASHMGLWQEDRDVSSKPTEESSEI